MAIERCGPGPRRSWSADSGAALIEALIAIAVLVTVTTSMAQLIVRSRRAVWTAGTQSMAVSIAQQKLEQLAALEWRVDAGGVRRSDLTTDLSVEPPTDGGSGLSRSPPDTLDRNVPGFVDFVGADARWIGRGASPTPGAVFVRRWAVMPHERDPADTLVFTVVVFPVADGTGRAVGPAVVRLQTIRTRTMR